MKQNWTKFTYTEAIKRGLFYSTASEILNLKSTRKPTKLLLGQLKVVLVFNLKPSDKIMYKVIIGTQLNSEKIMNNSFVLGFRFPV